MRTIAAIIEQNRTAWTIATSTSTIWYAKFHGYRLTDTAKGATQELTMYTNCQSTGGIWNCGSAFNSSEHTYIQSYKYIICVYSSNKLWFIGHSQPDWGLKKPKRIHSFTHSHYLFLLTDNWVIDQERMMMMMIFVRPPCCFAASRQL